MVLKLFIQVQSVVNSSSAESFSMNGAETKVHITCPFPLTKLYMFQFPDPSFFYPHLFKQDGNSPVEKDGGSLEGHPPMDTDLLIKVSDTPHNCPITYYPRV